MPAPQLRNRKVMADHVMDWMASRYPSWSIDTLLCHPHLAVAMGEWVCRKMRLEPSEANVSEVCRCALACRKRGDLRRDRV